jgi:histidinol-phosphate aminotransferase
MTYFGKHIHEMSGYKPGEQLPYPPSPAALKILHHFNGELLRRYPDPMGRQFRQVVSQTFNVPTDWILVGNGSDDLLTILNRACVASDRAVVYPTPTYVLYRTLAQIQDAAVVEIPYDEDYNLPVEQLIAADGALTLIASPNSPSGTAIPLDLLDKLASQLSGVLVIDEAYVDFAEANALELAPKYNNVIILRTLSKGYSLAGLRLGFAIANPSLLAGLVKVKDSYNVDAIAYAVGAAAVADQAYKIANAEKVKDSRSQLANAFKQLGFRVWPSQTNFLLVQPPSSNAEYLYEALKAQNILVRYFKQPRLEDKLRITVGTQEQNQTLIQTLSSLL